MLLQWVILESSGPSSNLAAVRFSAPVRIRSLRIYPTGCRPFKQQEDIVATTVPDSFYLDVYFNAHVISQDGKQKSKPNNALVPTSIAYQGGQVDFLVDMGTDFATRLMIVRGKFEKLSLAIYGDIISEPLPPLSSYEVTPLPVVSYNALPPALDPGNSTNPTDLALSLLSLIPDSPGLPLITRLMFCLKPSNDDWDDPEFPYLFSHLDKEVEGLSLEKAVAMTVRPVSDNMDETLLKSFASRLGDTIDEYNDDQAYFCAKLLSQCAPQHPELRRAILENIDLTQMFTLANLDRPTLLYLLDAAASFDIASQLSDRPIIEAILFIRDDLSQEDGARRAARKLYNRIKGWGSLESILFGLQSPFSEAVTMIKEISMEENSFGIWLENMTSNKDILDTLSDNAQTAQLLRHPPRMSYSNEITSRHDFITFLRAYIGVAAVVAIYAWSDSVPVDSCRERTLGVLRLWQNIDGYREIVNHLLLMRQMTYRLECMLPIDDDLPSQASIDAEHLLRTVAVQPASMLRSDFVKVMQNLRAPLNYITETEVHHLKRASSLAKQGLQGAVGLLIKQPDELDLSQKTLDLRVAVAMVMDTLQQTESGEQQVLECVWEQNDTCLPAHLIEHLAGLCSEVVAQFTLSVPSKLLQQEISDLFHACYDILSLIVQLLEAFPVTRRHTASLVRAAVELFVCTDSAELAYAQESTIYLVACAVRQACVSALNLAIFPSELNNDARSRAAWALKTLFESAAKPEIHDVSHHVTQVFWLLDHILPYGTSSFWEENQEARSTWLRQVITIVLPELQVFYHLQETENRVHLINRFMELDDGIIGVGEWLILEEQQSLARSIEFSHTNPLDSLHQCLLHWKITSSLRVLACLVRKDSSSCKQTSDVLLNHDENRSILLSALREFLDRRIRYECLDELIIALSSYPNINIEIRSAMISTLLRSTQCDRYEAFLSLPPLFSSSDQFHFDEEGALAFGDALHHIAGLLQAKRDLPASLAEAIYQVLDKLTPLDNSANVLVIRGLDDDAMKDLLRWMSEVLPDHDRSRLEEMKARWTMAGQPRNAPTSIPTDYQPEASLDDWEKLLSPPIQVPSTPKRRSPAQSAEMLGMITVSPPNALLRSPEVKGLTKTYANNDFRQLRQLSASRQNTSRLPSTHVDDFEQGASPIVPPTLSASPPVPLAVPVAFASPTRAMPVDPMLPMNPTFYQQ